MSISRGKRFFVSFSSRDLKYVREIMAALHGQELDFWNYADIIQSIELGEKIDERLVRQIDECDYMIVVISKNSTDPQIGRFCRFEMEYARNIQSKDSPELIPVLIKSHDIHNLEYPYDILEKAFCQELDDTPESIVQFTVKICKLIDKTYIPPVEAHPNLPFWKLFRKEAEDLAHSNKEHVELMMILGQFNEYYKRADLPRALFLIDYFLKTCIYFKVQNYEPFYPIIVKAVCETELGLYDEALKSYEKARTIQPENQDVIGGIGTVLFRMGKYREAADCFEQIIRNTWNENVTNARINLVITRLAMNEDISESEAGFLFQLDISGFPADLKKAIMNAKGVYLLKKGHYVSLERLCRDMMNEGLHDTITVRLLQLSFLNRGLAGQAEDVILNAMNEAKNNHFLDKAALLNYLKDIS